MTNKIGKIKKETEVRMPNPFDIGAHKTERSAVSVVMHWMRKIIEDNQINLGLPDVETGGKDKKFPDTIIHKSRRSQDILCVMEFKPPFWDVFAEDPKEPARKKATDRKAQYFVTANFRELIVWNTAKVNAMRPEEEQIVERYHLSDIFALDQLEESRYRGSIIKGLEHFLRDLFELSTGKKAEHRLAIDELLIYRLQEKIKKLAYYYRETIYDQAHKDQKFAKQLAEWFIKQGWSFFIESQSDYEKVARQTAYLLVNKILFYNALQLKRPDQLDPLVIPKDIRKGGLLKSILQGYFKEVLKIDYETIYTTDFIDEAAFPDSLEVVNEIKELVEILKRYDFSTLGFDVIGRIFERLIPEAERHNLGQYFTNPDVVDIILQFCSKNENDKILDPSCGAGTFLVRAYQQKKLMNQRLKHEEILSTLWGDDIAKFPAHLSTINLAINDLSAEKNYPNIIAGDFFDLKTSQDGFELPENVRKVKARTLGVAERAVIYPRWFDAVVGNPPYTRQEEISEISEEASYKEDLIKKALYDGNGKKLADFSKRAGIYTYFFVHGAKFLKNEGRFGFIVSNAWLDVEYGAGLQEFFLKNYKIVAIIESKVERWFADADINTCIVILEKATGKDKRTERDNNLVRFVYLLKPLRHFIPAAQNMWEKQIERKKAIDGLIKTILAHDEFYQNEELRIFPKKQSELYEEGFDKEENKFVGAKWGKYVRAPEIFFKILIKSKDKLIPLKEIADVRFGIKTGANEWFYLTEEEIKKRKIEKEYLQPIIFSLKEIDGFQVDKNKLSNKVILCCKDKKYLKGTNLLKYINEAEITGYHKRPTCESRKPDPWYCLGKNWFYAPLIFPAKIGERMPIFLSNNVFEDKKLYGIIPKNKNYLDLLFVILNSTLTRFFIEFTCRQLTGAQAIADIDVLVVKEHFILNINKLSQEEIKKIKLLSSTLLQSKPESIFKEIGTDDLNSVSIEKIVDYRRQIDKIIMQDILGLNEKEQLEVYKAVIDLVKSRIDKAKSVGRDGLIKSGIDINKIVETIIKKVGEKKVSSWYKEKIISQKGLKTVKLSGYEGESVVEKSLFGWQIKAGKKILKCGSEDEANYLKIWLEIGAESIKLPENIKELKKASAELQKLKKSVDNIIDSYLGSILDRKLKAQILHQVWKKLSR